MAVLLSAKGVWRPRNYFESFPTERKEKNNIDKMNIFIIISKVFSHQF